MFIVLGYLNSFIKLVSFFELSPLILKSFIELKLDFVLILILYYHSS
jgi:hypothetical protein